MKLNGKSMQVKESIIRLLKKKLNKSKDGEIE